MPPRPTALRRLGRLTVEHWPIKLMALVLAALLWAATTTQEPTTQLVPVQLVVEPPPGRALRYALPPVRALFSGSLRELIKLYGQPPIIQKQVPDTVSGAEYTIELSPNDLRGYPDADVRPQDVQPRMVSVALDEVMQRTIPVVHRVSIQPDSGFAQFGAVVVQPSSLLVRGPDARVRGLDAVFTAPLEIARAQQTVRRMVPIDTSGLSPIRLSHTQVEIVAEIGPWSERVFDGVPVEVHDPQGMPWQAQPATVAVTVRGAAGRITRLTIDSLSVVAVVEGRAATQTLHLAVQAPEGIAATAQPDSVAIRRRRG